MRHIIGLVVMAFAVSVSYLLGHNVGANTPTTQEVISQKWLVVQSCYEKGQQKEEAVRWLVSPSGEWLIIPEAYKSWASRLAEGQETDLPRFVGQWEKAVFPEERETADLRSIGFVKAGQHTYLFGKFFFAK